METLGTSSHSVKFSATFSTVHTVRIQKICFLYLIQRRLVHNLTQNTKRGPIQIGPKCDLLEQTQKQH